MYIEIDSIGNLVDFPLKDVQQYQFWQLWVFRENSSGKPQCVQVSFIVTIGRTIGKKNPMVQYKYRGK